MLCTVERDIAPNCVSRMRRNDGGGYCRRAARLYFRVDEAILCCMCDPQPKSCSAGVRAEEHFRSSSVLGLWPVAWRGAPTFDIVRSTSMIWASGSELDASRSRTLRA